VYFSTLLKHHVLCTLYLMQCRLSFLKQGYMKKPSIVYYMKTETRCLTLS